MLTAGLFVLAWQALRRLGSGDQRGAWVPFAAATGIFALCFLGLAYSFWPYVVPDRLDMWDAASAPESLGLIFVGTVVVMPFVIGYTIYLYRVFRGKARALSYE